MDFTGKSILITGGTTGIGRAIAARFASLGADVTVNYFVPGADVDEALKCIEKAGGIGHAVPGDVSNPDDAEAMAASASAKFGRLDILVNCAGFTKWVAFDDLDGLTPELWRKTMTVNAEGAFYCARAAAREMRKTGGGAITSIASVAGRRANGSSIAYCASKAALIHASHCLAKALAPHIRVNTVSPGFVGNTNWNGPRDGYDHASAYEKAASESLVGRIGTPDDIVSAVVYLSSGEASYITGIDFLVDGGRFYNV